MAQAGSCVLAKAMLPPRPCPVVISAAIEAEVAQLAPEDQGDYLASLGLKETGLARVVHAGYQLLDLVTFAAEPFLGP